MGAVEVSPPDLANARRTPVDVPAGYSQPVRRVGVDEVLVDAGAVEVRPPYRAVTRAVFRARRRIAQ
jgi:hypothetical protein